ncbi:clavesin-2-like [Stomoxys calcitrans]|uniref:clavesin-2-like n=1 Tax=Stomoxys calcitrans TaxID=35570 RepID=UPI0027E2AB6B|nr:clavesin-2-like [Stomoxys calcitrans]
MAKIEALNEELQKIANEELGEITQRIPKDLDAFKLWIQHQPHLKVRDDDQFLIQFLRGCKYSLEKAKGKLDLFFSLKGKYPELCNLTNVDEPKFREMNGVGFQLLPKPLNGTGPRIVAVRYNFSTSKYAIDDIFHQSCALHEAMIMNDPYACICGLVYIVDFSQATASHYLQMTPSFCKKLVIFLEKSMPLRIKSVYYIRTATAAQHFFKMLLPFFSEKLRQRIHIMGHDLSDLLQDIPPSYLPQDFGGELPLLDELASSMDDMWDKHKEYFKMNALCGCDESLRPGKPLDIDGLFGVGGSFRQIIVD